MSITGTILLPPLREDIDIEAGAPDETGAPTWVIHDPLQHRYFQIDRMTRALLLVWREGANLQQMARIASHQLDHPVDPQQIEKLLEFVRINNLTREDQPGTWHTLSERALAAKNQQFRQVAQKYLFFKIPLLKPQRALQAMLPYVEPLYSPVFLKLLACIGVIGLYLTSRQWDRFLGTFDQFYSLEGILYFAFSLFFLKAMHELGHAFTAVRLGCRVPTMGVAFMMMTPLLYTDVSDAWRLTSRRQRILISAAGIVVELALAIIATLLWVFLPDSISRSIAFMIATTGWIMSLGLNLNPCMKFDGYYLFSDLLGIDNLQSRAFALGRWKMRQLLFAPHMPPPEQFSPRLNKVLISYAWITWLYRLVIFTAIALVIYHFFFKLLGLALLALEIWLLILLPIYKEIGEWLQTRRHAVSASRLAVILSLSSALLVLFVLPWSTRIEVPAVLVAADLTRIYPARAAEVVSVDVSRHSKVRQGELLLNLQVPEIEFSIRGTKIKLNLTTRRLARLIADRADLNESLVLRQELGYLQTKLNGLLKEKRELSVRAPIDGTVLQITPNLHKGRWVGKHDLLALVASGRRYIVKGYVTEDNLQRLANDAKGRFIPDDLTRSAIPVRLKRVARTGSRSIDIVELASTVGGNIAVEPGSNKRLVPVSAQYLVEMEPQGFDTIPNQIIRGVVYLKGYPESFLLRSWRQISKVLVRESGF